MSASVSATGELVAAVCSRANIKLSHRELDWEVVVRPYPVLRVVLRAYIGSGKNMLVAENEIRVTEPDRAYVQELVAMKLVDGLLHELEKSADPTNEDEIGVRL